MCLLSAGNVQRSVICKLELDEVKVQEFKDAIENTYWFEFFMGGLLKLIAYC